MYIKDVKVFGLKESKVASGYPMRSDITESHDINYDILSANYPKRYKALANSRSGEGHDNYLKGIIVQFDLCISNKAWVEAERYHFFDFVSSCSTMHKICSIDIRQCCNKYVWDSTINNLELKVKEYNSLADKNTQEAKELYLEILYNIPSGFELVARMTTNYQQLKTIYFQRRYHRLPDWHMVCDWIETLPESNLITDKIK